MKQLPRLIEDSSSGAESYEENSMIDLIQTTTTMRVLYRMGSQFDLAGHDEDEQNLLGGI